jgi:CRISPR/Cas system CSM-associated protein Csm3 (group 7 of RAMP superfamily)
MSNARWLKSREVVKRIVIQGELILETPARFGNGDSDGLVDMSLALDPLEGRALLTGASLAGALRNYLRERENGYWQPGGKESLEAVLFGRQEDDEGEQSLLITYDSLGDKPILELRDGVAIDPRTRTAEEKKKYDFELIEAGCLFPLRMELLVQEQREQELLRGLAIALQGLERGEIPLGARKRRGFGRCLVEEWRVCRYDLTNPEGLIGWLENDRTGETKGRNISDLLEAEEADLDRRETFTLEATFTLDGSLLIRSGFGEADAPDAVHLHSNRRGRPAPILSGTSLAGALRARAWRIVKTLGSETTARKMIDELFGPRLEPGEDKPAASRLITAETEVSNPLNLVQSRVKIDRFTGGSFPTALFSEQPVFGQQGTGVGVKVALQQPNEAQIGLLLLLLKDLWTGDLTLGGEASVGRGRLCGKKATLVYKKAAPKESQTWEITQADGQLQVMEDKACLEQFVAAFRKEVQG